MLSHPTEGGFFHGIMKQMYYLCSVRNKNQDNINVIDIERSND